VRTFCHHYSAFWRRNLGIVMPARISANAQKAVSPPRRQERQGKSSGFICQPAFLNASSFNEILAMKTSHIRYFALFNSWRSWRLGGSGRPLK
jgi:hypothetical protein